MLNSSTSMVQAVLTPLSATVVDGTRATNQGNCFVTLYVSSGLLMFFRTGVACTSRLTFVGSYVVQANVLLIKVSLTDRFPGFSCYFFSVNSTVLHLSFDRAACPPGVHTVALGNATSEVVLGRVLSAPLGTQITIFTGGDPVAALAVAAQELGVSASLFVVSDLSLNSCGGYSVNVIDDQAIGGNSGSQTISLLTSLVPLQSSESCSPVQNGTTGQTTGALATDSLSTGAIVGIAIGVACFAAIAVVVGVLIFKHHEGAATISRNREIKAMELNDLKLDK
jgi:hypothetical protein